MDCSERSKGLLAEAARRAGRLSLAIALPLALGACAHAPPSAALSPAGPADLTVRAAGGELVTLGSLWEGKRALAVVFWSAGCPCVRRYQERVEALRREFPEDAVRIVGVASNAGESFDEVLKAARERGATLPLYRDETGEVAAALGARSTPTAVVLDGRGAIRFLGWIDNERDVGEGDRVPYLERAIAGVVRGTSDFDARTPRFGCAITRRVGGTEHAHCGAPEH
jgi:hypothetical protein